MSELLYLKASPRTKRSHSIAVADAFLETYLESNPGDTISVLDVFERDLPQFEGDMLQGKYNIMHGLQSSAEQRRRWSLVESLIEEFSRADKYVLAVPMWNFHIPYRLKQYLDIIIQPTLTYRVTEEGGYAGLLTGTIYVSYARGGQYKPGTPGEAYNHQAPYLEMILAFMGLEVACTTAVEGSLAGGETARASRQEAILRARELAADF